MKRLAGADALFLAMETPSWHQHVGGLTILDPGDRKVTFADLVERVEERIPLAPKFRWKLKAVPFNLDRPVWVDDPHFDVRRHIRRIGVPSPGGLREVAEVAGTLLGWQLDRRRPLWELWFFEGLANGRLGFLLKYHHCLLDGIAGASLASVVMDLERDPDPDAPSLAPEPEETSAGSEPSDVELLVRSLTPDLRQPARLVRFFGGALAKGATMVGVMRRDEEARALVRAPRTPFNAAIGPQRALAYSSVSIEDVRAVKAAHDVKVNDVVLTLCAGAIRSYLVRLGALPEAPLVTAVPVSTRADGDTALDNQITTMFVSLATDVADPVERLRAVFRSSQSAKEMTRAVGARQIQSIGEVAAPLLIGTAIRAAYQARLVTRSPMRVNTMVSNVPGPPFPVYICGARVTGIFPSSVIMEGMGLNVTVFSYEDRVDFGFHVDPDLVPDPWDLAEGVPGALEELMAASGLGAPSPIDNPFGEEEAVGKEQAEPQDSSERKGSFNLSELFEQIADAVPDREAIATPGRRVTYRELEERANRLAHHLAAHGIGPGDHVGLQLLNGTEYLEGMLAAFKLRAVPINVNYRYVERELEHLYDDADLAALVFHRQFASRVKAVAPAISTLRQFLVVDDGTEEEVPEGTVGYEQALAAGDPGRDFAGRSDDDLFCAYTGGTTGMPKGVLWRHEDIFFAALGGGDPTIDKGPITAPDELAGRIPDFPLVQLCAPPLMHVSAHWGAFNSFFGGGKVVLLGTGRYDPAEVWETVAREGVNVITVVGDAMARPLLDALETSPEAWDTSGLFVFASGGAILSASTKAQIARLLPNVIVIDAFGSSETGVSGSRSSSGGGAGAGGGFTVNDTTAVLDDDLRPVTPGSGEVGRLARRGHVPLGYHKDEVKTRSTFVEVDGVRWVLPGDMATVEEDGTVAMLGRGSGSINTGGEKVYPEEVEAVLKGHADVFDVLVVGVPDDRWGERVVALVQPREGATPTLEDLQAHARTELAGYKLPRDLCVVEVVERSPSGKPDYAWAKTHAAETLALSGREAGP